MCISDNATPGNNRLTIEDLAIISMCWLALTNLGYMVADLDLSQPDFVQQIGPHRIYSFAVLLRDDEEFPEKDFTNYLEALYKNSKFKPHYYGIEHFPADSCVCYDPSNATYLTEPLKNFSHVYISVYL